jgi:hypothetical protein
VGLISNGWFYSSENKMKNEQFRMLDDANNRPKQVSYTDENVLAFMAWRDSIQIQSCVKLMKNILEAVAA